MGRYLFVGFVAFCGFLLLVAASPPDWLKPAPIPPSPSLSKTAIERAVEDCRRLLGLRDDTIMTMERIALMSLCMSPELKQVAPALKQGTASR